MVFLEVPRKTILLARPNSPEEHDRTLAVLRRYSFGRVLDPTHNNTGHSMAFLGESLASRPDSLRTALEGLLQAVDLSQRAPRVVFVQEALFDQARETLTSVAGHAQMSRRQSTEAVNFISAWAHQRLGVACRNIAQDVLLVEVSENVSRDPSFLATDGLLRALAGAASLMLIPVTSTEHLYSIVEDTR